MALHLTSRRIFLGSKYLTSKKKKKHFVDNERNPSLDMHNQSLVKKKSVSITPWFMYADVVCPDHQVHTQGGQRAGYRTHSPSRDDESRPMGLIVCRRTHAPRGSPSSYRMRLSSGFPYCTPIKLVSNHVKRPSDSHTWCPKGPRSPRFGHSHHNPS